MQDLEQLLAENEELIKKVIRKLKIYRDFEDYMQVGRIALWQATKNFDETKGEFAMFAYMAIQFAIVRALNKSSDVARNEMNDEDEKMIATIEQPQDAPYFLAWPEWFYTLSTEEQLLLTLIFQEGLTGKEIADKYQLNYETIKKRRQRLLSKLREMGS